MARSARVQINLASVEKKAKKIQQIVREEKLKMAEEVAKFGELEMKSNILASGTAFSQRARQAGVNKGPGRYRSGNMFDSVTSKVQAGPKIVRAAFGWLDNFEKYFEYQELGFKNKFRGVYTDGGRLQVEGGQPVVERIPFGGSRPTKGMFALRDARLSVVQELPRFEKKYAGIIKRRIRALSK